jgi:hypothetical protein
LWKIDEEKASLEIVPLPDGISPHLDQLTSVERESQLELPSSLDKSGELFLLVNYNIAF